MNAFAGKEAVKTAVRHYMRHTDQLLCANSTKTHLFLRSDIGIPDVFLSRLSLGDKCKLEHRLRACDDGEYFCLPRQALIVHVQNGLGNRLRVLASAMEFAYLTKRVLVVIWAKDAHLRADMDSLFDEEAIQRLIVINDDLAWPLLPTMQVEIPLIYEDNFVYINRMEKDTTRKFPTPIVQNVPGRHMYVKTAYIFDKTKDAPDVLANALLQSLKPAPLVLSIVADLERRHGPLHNMIGVHMRTRHVKDENRAIDVSREYTTTSIEVADRWRSMSAPSNFAPAMISSVNSPYPTRVRRQMRAVEIQKWRQSPWTRFLPDSWAPHDASSDNQPQFFVSSDDQESIEEVRALCKCSVIYIPQKCKNRNGECVISAFADIIALSRCGALLLSGWSSFSEAATRLRVRDDDELEHLDQNLFSIRFSGVNFGLTPSPTPKTNLTPPLSSENENAKPITAPAEASWWRFIGWRQ